MKRILLIGLLVFVLMLSLLGFSSAKEGTYVLKVGTKMPENNPESAGVLRVCELVKERSNGRLEIVPYFHEALGNAVTQIEGVMLGTQDMYFESYISYEHWVPEFAVHCIPYLFKDNEEYREFLLSDIEKEYEEKLLQATGLKILNTKRNWLRGPYRVIATKKPILKIEDCDGIKLRQSAVKGADVSLWQSIGAKIITVNWSETYLALKQGIVNAVTSPISLLYSMKFTEVCPYVTITNEYSQQMAFIMRDDKFKSLPEDLQKILVDAIDEAGEYESEQVRKAAIEDIKKMEEEHGAKFYDIGFSEKMLEKAEVLFPELEKKGLLMAGITSRVIEWRDSK